MITIKRSVLELLDIHGRRVVKYSVAATKNIMKIFVHFSFAKI